MRCLSCNAELDDVESVRKDPETNEYVDLCNECYYSSLDFSNDGFIIGD